MPKLCKEFPDRCSQEEEHPRNEQQSQADGQDAVTQWDGRRFPVHADTGAIVVPGSTSVPSHDPDARAHRRYW